MNVLWGKCQDREMGGSDGSLSCISWSSRGTEMQGQHKGHGVLKSEKRKTGSFLQDQLLIETS